MIAPRHLFSALLLLGVACQQGASPSDEPPDQRAAAKAIVTEFESHGPSAIEARTPNRPLAPLRFAVASMLSPAANVDAYRDLFERLSEATGRTYIFVQRPSYQEINDLLLAGKIDLAFLCTGAVAALPAGAPVTILAVPQVHGRTTYQSYLITQADRGDIAGWADLRGKRFAFTDPLSRTGYQYALWALRDLGETPEHFFASTTFTHSHDASILAVYRHLVDAAVVDGIIFDSMAGTGSLTAGHLRVVARSKPYPIPPVVIPTSLPGALAKTLRSELLHLDEDAPGRATLAKLGFDRFVLPEPGVYAADRAAAHTGVPARNEGMTPPPTGAP